MARPATLTEAIRQTRPFDSPRVEALLTLAWAADGVAQETDRPLRDRDISSAQYNVLRILRGSPQGLQVHEVVARMITRAPNITRLVDKLEARGRLTRTPCPEDRRAIILHIAPQGIRLLDELADPMKDAADRSAQGLSEPELTQLIDLLNRLRGGILEECKETL